MFVCAWVLWWVGGWRVGGRAEGSFRVRFCDYYYNAVWWWGEWMGDVIKKESIHSENRIG